MGKSTANQLFGKKNIQGSKVGRLRICQLWKFEWNRRGTASKKGKKKEKTRLKISIYTREPIFSKLLNESKLDNLDNIGQFGQYLTIWTKLDNLETMDIFRQNGEFGQIGKYGHF